MENTEDNYCVPAKKQKIEGAKTRQTAMKKSDIGVKTLTTTSRSVNLPVERVRADDKQRQSMENVEYRIDSTVILNVEGSEVDVDELIESVENLCGEGTILGCVRCERNVYEVTMINNDCCNLIVPSVQVGELHVSACCMSETSTFVSIINLPTYITDSEIREKMQTYKIQIVSPIYKRCHRRNKEKKKVVDGTRYFRVKFPEGVKSLPWSLAFTTRGITRHFKTVHDNQSKVCFKCCSDEHLARDCVLSQCYTCFAMGHISINCPEKKCKDCDRSKNECECESEEDEGTEYESESVAGESDSNEESVADMSSDNAEEESQTHEQIGVDAEEKIVTNILDEEISKNEKQKETIEQEIEVKRYDGRKNSDRQKINETQDTDNEDGKSIQNDSTIDKRTKKPENDNKQTTQRSRQRRNVTHDTNTEIEGTSVKTQATRQNKESRAYKLTVTHETKGNSSTNTRNDSVDKLEMEDREKLSGRQNDKEVTEKQSIKTSRDHATSVNCDNAEKKVTTERPPRRNKIKFVPNLNCASRRERNQQRGDYDDR